MIRLWVCAALFLLASLAPASAWDHDGHQLVGSIADQLLEKHLSTKRQVESILGFSLRQAATWPDCARSVKPHQDGTFRFVFDADHPQYTVPCPPFLFQAEQRLEDYVARNWNNCAYAEGKPNLRKGCHETYHFADVPIQRGRYQPGYAGTNEHDIVHAINAAIAVLKGRQPPPPFSIRDKREALFLLAHFVGDLHQPLHVGGVYLDANGNLVDPATPADVKEEQETFGGNSLFDVRPGNERVPLHVIWDDTPKELGSKADKALVDDAAKVAATSGDMSGWAAAWASDSVVEADKAFKGLTFAKKGEHGWDIIFTSDAARTDYLAKVSDAQRKQIYLAGARLAEILKAVWP